MSDTQQNTAQLEHIEQLVYSGNYEKAANLLLKVLAVIDIKRVGMKANRDVSAAEQDYQQMQLNTRLAGAITSMMADNRFQLSQQGFEVFMAYKRQLRAIFMASGFRNMDHLPWQMSEKSANGQRTVVNDSSLRKLLIAISPSSPMEHFNYQEWVKSLPAELALPFWLSFLDTDIVLSQQDSASRRKITMMYDQIKLPSDYQLHKALFTRVINAWMFTSYMDFPEKHQPKKFLNQLIRQYGQQAGIKEPPMHSNTTASGKPIMVIALEQFVNNHAMHRCYRPAVDSLRKYFYTIGICMENSIDDKAKKAFDEVQTFDPQESFKKIAGKIVKIKPAAIYYPSLGMQHWSVALAQFRFAPLQVMSLGHPATSMTETIDYAFTGDTDPELFSEKIVRSADAEKMQHAIHPEDADYTKIERNDETIRIAVNAKLYKINHHLIEACQNIRNNSKKDVEFFFFPNTKGLVYEAFQEELGRHIDAKVFPTKDYTSFIDTLRTCDMALNPFPFGNTNGINDCARIGIPFVCMDGKEPHSHVDAAMSEVLGYPDFLRANNIEEYTNAAIRLVEDEELRESLIHNTIKSKAADRITGSEAGESKFGKAVYKLYWHHETLKHQNDRIVDLDKMEDPEEIR